MGMIDYVRRPSRALLLKGVTPRWIENSPRRDYIKAVVLSTPDWVDRGALRRLKAHAAALTKTTGVLHVLDHKVPLNHPNVCGLTVPWNLQVVHWKANGSKGNKWEPDQLHLFDIDHRVEMYETLEMFDFECE